MADLTGYAMGGGGGFPNPRATHSSWTVWKAGERVYLWPRFLQEKLQLVYCGDLVSAVVDLGFLFIVRRMGCATADGRTT